MRTAAAGEAGWPRAGHAVDRATIIVRARPASGGGAWVTLEDVTELQRLRRIRSEFIDNLSHELRTPLANVRLLTEMLMDDLEREECLRPASASASQTIDVETGHLVQMVNELLDLSRMEQAATPIRRDEVALPPLVAATLQRLRTFAERQGVILVDLVPDDLPPVRGDEERLDQLLMNLLHNAIKFSPAGRRRHASPPTSTRITWSSRCTDQGMGIPGQDQDARLRALLQGRSGAPARPRRHRPGAGHRAPHRRGARRSHLARIDRGPGLHVQLLRALRVAAAAERATGPLRPLSAGLGRQQPAQLALAVAQRVCQVDRGQGRPSSWADPAASTR